MKNEQDYKAGWTKQTTNPATGKKCSGGAARNLKIAQFGGVNTIQVAAAVQTVQTIQPIVDAQQVQIQQQQAQIGALTQSLTQAINALTKNNDQ